MSLKKTIYNKLPAITKPVAKKLYLSIIDFRKNSDEYIHSEFIDEVFDDKHEYEKYASEFKHGSGGSLYEKAIRKYQKITGAETLGGVSLQAAKDYYAIIRKREPSKVVETGVCNGISTLAILLALNKNGSGRLYSIDYPFRANESLEEFQKETFENYGGAAIPSDKEPGWIIPDELRSQWDLIIGKSQRELPQLLTELGAIDLFIHDSEHSHPCMMFEYELAYEWLKMDGLILSDDILWNDAFNIFTETREVKNGRLSRQIGYVMKQA